MATPEEDGVTEPGNYKARIYQTEMIELAKKRNIIVCLPTGCGKTFISLQLAKHYLPRCIEKGMFVVFIANTVPLVKQQAKYFQDSIPSDPEQYNIVALTGEDNVDMWSGREWRDVLNKSTLCLFLTPQILLDAIKHDFISFKDIILLILDECHHADKEHPMSGIMKLYGKEYAEKGDTDLPRVLGLTATIIRGLPKNEVWQEIADIEARLCAKAVTYYDYGKVLEYSTKAHKNINMIEFCNNVDLAWNSSWYLEPLINARSFLNENKEYFQRPKNEFIQHTKFLKRSQELTNKDKYLTRESTNILTELIEVFQDLGPYAARIGAAIRKFFILGKVLGDPSTDEEFILLYTSTAISRFLARIESLLSQLPISDQIDTYISPKMKKLVEILEEYRDKEDLSGLVFTKKRITAQILNWYFTDARDKCGNKYKFLSPGFVIGSSRDHRDPAENRITTKKQSKVILEFRKGLMNLLIATSVLEEGMDVPSCNLVIRFDSIPTYPSFVQSMGRARSENARFVFFKSLEDVEQSSNISKYQNYNLKLSNFLIQNALHLDNEETDLDIGMNANVGGLDEYVFKPGENYPIIDLTSAIPIVNRYCGTLATDRYTPNNPYSFWVDDPETHQFKAYVQMPPNSVVRGCVEGEYMPSKVLAKKVAHLEVCKQLFGKGVLDEKLFPKRPALPAPIQVYFNETENDSGLKGNNGNWIRKKNPDVFKKNIFQVGAQFKAYKICINLTMSKPDPEIEKIYDFESRNHFFCILTQFPLDIPQFVLSARFGDLTVRLEEIKLTKDGVVKKSLDEVEVMVLEEIQDYIFLRLLGKKDELGQPKIHPALQRSTTPFYYIAPIFKANSGFELYLKMLNDLMEFEEGGAQPESETRRGMTFNEEDYKDGLVITWYKAPEVHLVISILRDMNAKSQLSEAKSSYEDYFVKNPKYECIGSLYHPQLPLLKCKKMAKQLNFLNLKHTINLSKEERKENLDEGRSMELVPELVNLCSLPGMLYVQTFYLPSIIQRMTRFILSKEIRDSIARRFNWSAALDAKACEMREESQVVQTQSPSENLTFGKDPSGINNNKAKGDGERVGTSKAAGNEEDWHYEWVHPFSLTRDSLKGQRDRNSQIKSGMILGEKEENWKSRKVRRAQLGLVDLVALKLPQLDYRPDFSVEPGPNLYTIMQATTIRGSHEKFNMEKLETLGDSYLKFIVSANLFVHYPDWCEGIMSQGRSKIVSNANLYGLGRVKLLGEVLAGGFFNPGTSWLPPGTTVLPTVSELAVEMDMILDYFQSIPRDRLAEANIEELRAQIQAQPSISVTSPGNVTFSHAKIKSKNVADCTEALIGAYWLNGGAYSALRFLDWLGLRIPKLDGTTAELLHPLDFPKSLLDAASKIGSVKHSVEDFLPFRREFEDFIGYNFKNPWLLVEALTHPGFIRSPEDMLNSYERLEYLGDATLDFLVTQHIYSMANCKTPGDLTDLRSALVNNITFGSLALRFGFDKHLLKSDQKLSEAIGHFRESQEENGDAVIGHFTLFNDLEAKYSKDIQVPKALGDLFESIAGAILLDSGMSLDTVWTVFYRLMKKEIDEFSTNIPKSPVRVMYESFPNSVQCRNLDISEIARSNPGNMNLDWKYVEMTINGVKFRGCGTNRKSAKMAACKYAQRYFADRENGGRTNK